VIAKELQSLSLVGYSEFRKLFANIGHGCNVWNLKIVFHNRIPVIYTPTLERVKSDINDVTAIFLRTDGWTSINNFFLRLRHAVSIKIQNRFQVHWVVQTHESDFTRCVILLYQEFVTEQLHFLCPTLKQSLGSYSLKSVALWKQLWHDGGFVTSSLLFLSGSNSWALRLKDWCSCHLAIYFSLSRLNLFLPKRRGDWRLESVWCHGLLVYLTSVACPFS
jgi:hypothetical protein